MYYSYDKSWALGGCPEIFLLPTFLTYSTSHETLAALKQLEKKNWFVQTHSHPVNQLCCKHKIIINCNFLVVHKSLAWLGHIFNDTVYILADLIPFTLKNIYIECTSDTIKNC